MKLKYALSFVWAMAAVLIFMGCDRHIKTTGRDCKAGVDFTHPHLTLNAVNVNVNVYEREDGGRGGFTYIYQSPGCATGGTGTAALVLISFKEMSISS